VSGDTVTVLLVEDDKVDRMAIRRSFRLLKIGNPVIEVGDGIEALERLRGENGAEKIAPPYLILLDLNMPRMNGIEFLTALRADRLLRRDIVFVLTTSSAEEDRIRAYDMNVSGYILKENVGQGFLDAVTMLSHFWRVVQFPTPA
jgi:CheY-like chemotaxis protein